MNRATLLEFGLVGFFMALAVAEAFIPSRNRASAVSGDARLLTNFGLTAMVLVAGGALPLARIASAIGSERLGLGLTHVMDLSWTAVLLATLLLDSFAAYWVHRVMHATPLLWRLHRVHHSDHAVDVSTSLRNHPLELLVTVPSSVIVVLILGSPPSVVLATQTIFMAVTIWEHADIELPNSLDRMLSLAIVTPSRHRVHHGVDRKDHDSNFGDFLTLWDQLFGTFVRTKFLGPVGLTGQRARGDHLLQQIISPLDPA